MSDLREVCPVALAPESALLRRAHELNVLSGESIHPWRYWDALRELILAVCPLGMIELTTEEAEQVDHEMRSATGNQKYHQQEEG